MTDLEQELHKLLKRAKTPKQVYAVYDRFSSQHLARVATIALAYDDNFINEVGNITHADKLHQQRDRNGHRKDQMTKKTALALASVLRKYSERLLNKINRLENPK